jgi:hypothetical protein
MRLTTWWKLRSKSLYKTFNTPQIQPSETNKQLHQASKQINNSTLTNPTSPKLTTIKMKATTVIISILSVALTATAAPAMDSVLEERTGGGGGTTTTCSAKGYKQVCCNSGLLGCLVQILGSHCSQQAYCCKTDASTVSPPSHVLSVFPEVGFVN